MPLVNNYIDGTKDIRLTFFDDQGFIEYYKSDASKTYKGILLDTETTGLDPVNDKVIQLALVEFTFDNCFNILSQDKVHSWFQDPFIEIPEKITTITGITTDMVVGKFIDWDEVTRIVSDAKVVIAHHAAFDRKFLNAIPEATVFKDKVWACSKNDIPWADYLITSNKLEYLCWNYGFHYQAHDARADCVATLKLLTQKMPGSDKNAFEYLLRAAFTTWVTVYAWASPFETKDVLKANGYYWDGTQKVWFKTVNEKHLELEEEFLSKNVYDGTSKAEIKMQNNKERFL